MCLKLFVSFVYECNKVQGAKMFVYMTKIAAIIDLKWKRP